MPRLTMSSVVKKAVTQGLFVAALAGVIGVSATRVAAAGPRLWSIVVHFEYADGFELDYVLDRGVTTAEMAGALADCGRSHWTGSVVRYHCYPMPE
jgi:hypothetical protein